MRQQNKSAGKNGTSIWARHSSRIVIVRFNTIAVMCLHGCSMNHLSRIQRMPVVVSRKR